MKIRQVALSKNQGLLLTILIMAFLIAVHYGGLLKNLGSSLTAEPYRDGIKTYINAAYHAQYDSTYTYFGGMNYPYKEHIVAATEFPGLAVLLKWVRPVFPKSTQYVFGVVHSILLLSMLLCAMLLYLIFEELGLPVWYAVLVAIGLTFLAPQNMRFVPHIGLAPLFVIPAVLYGLLLFERRPRWGASVSIGLTVVLSSLLHFYFFGITVFAISFYLLFSLLRRFSWKRVGQLAAHYTVMVLLPLLFFYGWMIANDPITDRTPKPFGFIVMRAKWESLFLSMEMPYFKWIDEYIVTIEKTDFEGWSYVGLVAGVFTVVVLLRWLCRLFRKPLFDFSEEKNRSFYYPLMGAGAMLALFACAQPFATKGLVFLLDYTGPLQQFRSTGRFAWVFYFAINILAFAGFYRLFSSWEKAPRLAAHLILVAVLAFEAYTFARSPYNYADAKLQQIPELLPGQRFTDLPGIDFSKYQAIVPVSYYNVGSDNLIAIGGAYTIQKSLVLSEQTGLPVTGAMLTRSSRRQSYNQMQLVTEPYRHPVVLDDYPNQKPLLLLYCLPFFEEDKRRYDHLLEASRLLHENESWRLFEMDFNSFDQRIALRKGRLRQAMLADTLYRLDGFTSTDSLRNFVYENFDSNPARRTYLGNGAFERDITRANMAWSGSLPNPQAGGGYHLLAWVYVDEDRLTSTTIRIREEDGNGRQLKESSFGVSFQIEVYDPNGWVLVDCPFELASDKGKLSVTFQWPDGAGRRLFVDELLIKPRTTDLYRESNDLLWWNNRFWKIEN